MAPRTVKKSSFEAALSAETVKIADSLFRGNSMRRRVLMNTASLFFTASDTLPFENFINTPGFALFMKQRKSISAVRFEHTLTLVFRRLTAGIDPDLMGGIAGVMGSDRYLAAERSFFKLPVDWESYTIFQNNFITIGEQNITLTETYLDFILSANFVFLKSEYRKTLDIFGSIMRRITLLLLAAKKKEPVFISSSLLIQEFMVSIVNNSFYIGKGEEFLEFVFGVFHYHSDPELFFSFIKAVAQRYRGASGTNEKLKQILYDRMIEIWGFAYNGDKALLEDFREFLNLYGNSRDEFETFIWDTVFSLEPVKAGRAVTLLSSSAFNSLKGFYSNDRAIIKFLVKNIIAAISELDIRNLASPLYSIVIKLFIGLKLNRTFIKHRADFFSWLKTVSSSVRLELEVIRFMFFEYIYIALHLVPEGHSVKMTRFCDGNHRFFVEKIDSLPPSKTKVNETEYLAAYAAVLKMLRDYIWKVPLEKFIGEEFTIRELRSIAESTGTEDEILDSLDKVEPSELADYAGALHAVFRSNPGRMSEAVQSDYWYRVELSDALPDCYSVLIPVVGTADIKESEAGPYTDGRSIYLPSFVNYFKDPLEPLNQNRNLTVYIASTLHEAGHIIGGSYSFNWQSYLDSVERPELFKSLWNAFEDFRIESFLVKISAHHQVKEILTVLNEYLSASNFYNFTSMSFSFILYIYDEAGGYNGFLKKYPPYNDMIERIMNAGLNSGRFRSLKELAEYGITRLRNLDIYNPLAAYPLAREFYEIMKLWPDNDLHGFADRNLPLGGEPSGISAPGGSSAPLTRDELDELYRNYNKDPEKFLKERGLKTASAILSDDEGDGAGKSVADYIENMFGEYRPPSYDELGTIDFSTRTRADDAVASEQIEESAKSAKKKTDKKTGKGKKKSGKPAGKKGKEGVRAPETEKEKAKYVYSINPDTGSRTRLSEIREFPITGINHRFMARFSRWEYLTALVEQQLAMILPTVEEQSDFSAMDGELDMDLLIDIISDKSRSLLAPEIFEVRTESRRSLEVAIGLDASGSTSADISSDGDTVLDIEKVFAIIFGRALQYLTDNVNVYAFNSATSTNIYKAVTVDAASSFSSGYGNRDGDFIRYVTHQLKQSDAEVKYFFLLSDGQPAADNYYGKEAFDDTLIAMRETVTAGIKLVYFNFDVVKSEYFDLFQREATYARYFTSPEEILSALASMLRNIAVSVM